MLKQVIKRKIILSKNPIDYLDQYHKEYGPFLVQGLFNGSIGAWVPYNSYKYKKMYQEKNVIPNNREVLPDEIFIDIDSNKYKWDFEDDAYKENKYLKDIIVARLREDGFSFGVWRNGSKTGHHIQELRFPSLLNFSAEHRKELKKLFIKKYGWGFMTSKKKRAHVDTNWCCPVEYTQHRKTRNLKYRIQLINADKLNIFPQDVIEKWLDQKKEEQARKDKVIIMPPGGYGNINEPLPCISFLESLDFRKLNDGRKRAVWIIISHYKRKLNEKDLELKAINYSEQLNEPYHHSYVRNLITREIKTKKQVGCTYIREYLGSLGEENVMDKHCSNCPIYLKRCK